MPRVIGTRINKLKDCNVMYMANNYVSIYKCIRM